MHLMCAAKLEGKAICEKTQLLQVVNDAYMRTTTDYAANNHLILC